MAQRTRAKKAAVTAGLLLALPLLTGGIGTHTSFDQRILAAHNRERALQGVPPLRWNPALAVGAQDWAVHLARTGRFEHSPDEVGVKPIGENIWGGTPQAFQPEAMVAYWVAEKRHYKPGVFPRNSRTGNVDDVSHFTQVIWRRSGEVGCALAGGRREEILVCRYSDSGNVIGQTPI